MCTQVRPISSTIRGMDAHRKQLGTSALEGKEEYLVAHIFGGVDHDRKITGRGTLIMIFDPKAEDNAPPYWEYTNTEIESTNLVPRGFKVKVVDARVKMTKSDAA